MAFAQRVAVSSAIVLTNGTSHVVTLPSGSGGRVLVYFHKDGTGVPTHDGSGWTEFRSATTCGARAYMVAMYKDDGGESSLTFTTTSEMCSWYCVRLSGYDAATAPEFATAGNTTNPPSITASWGSADNLFIVGHGGDPAWSYTTAAPANYSSGYLETGNISASNEGVSLAFGYRELAAASDDPGAWTLGADSDHESFITVIRPGSGGGGGSPTPETLAAMGVG